MKSKILGASLALGLIAVGFTSCYDSVNESVVVPAKPAAPAYQVTGYVTDYLTENAIGGATVSGAVSTTTQSDGSYFAQSSSPINGTITFGKKDGGYKDLSIPVVMKDNDIKTGLLSYNLNVALKKDGYIEGVLVAVTTYSGEPTTVLVDDHECINSSDEPTSGTAVFDELDFGAKAENASEEFKKYLGIYGITELESNFTQKKQTFVGVPVPARSKVTAYTATPIIQKETYTMPDGDVLGEVERVVAYHVVANAVSLDHGHYAGHDTTHGHGPGNAGGGIFGAE